MDADIVKKLHRSALWLIIDPWSSTPYKADILKWPNIDQHNAVTSDLISAYLHNVKHVAVSCPQFVDHQPVQIAEPFRHYPNTQGSLKALISIMTALKLKRIVYCGFHYGHCIVNKPDGLRSASKFYKTWVKRDLCATLPFETFEQHDRNTIKYAELI